MMKLSWIGRTVLSLLAFFFVDNALCGEIPNYMWKPERHCGLAGSLRQGMTLTAEQDFLMKRALREKEKQMWEIQAQSQMLQEQMVKKLLGPGAATADSVSNLSRQRDQLDERMFSIRTSEMLEERGLVSADQLAKALLIHSELEVKCKKEFAEPATKPHPLPWVGSMNPNDDHCGRALDFQQGLLPSETQEKRLQQITLASQEEIHTQIEQLGAIQMDKVTQLLSPGTITIRQLAPLTDREDRSLHRMNMLRVEVMLQMRELATADQLAQASLTHDEQERLCEQDRSPSPR